jgi:uncharacterized membrane protein YkoI
MNRTMKLVAGGAVALAVAGGTMIGIAAATGAGGDDSEPAITGDALDQASAAALAHTGGGTVTDTEVGDEESLFEVEVTLDDGSQVDVQLDENFAVVGDEADGPDDGESSADDD